MLTTNLDALRLVLETEFAKRPMVSVSRLCCKNYDGCGSVWSAHLAAMMVSVLQTLLLWGLNPHHWLSAFLQACADQGGQSPADLSPFVPWQMSAERRQALSRPLPVPALGGVVQEPQEPKTADTS
jgi:transposase